MAARVAQDIPEGWYVNLGIGIPTLIADHIPADREVVVHSENGILGMGPAPGRDKENPWLVNASSQRVSLRPGGSYVHHADSFAIVRGGHLDLCVLGGFQVAANGDLANWAHSATRNRAADRRRDGSRGRREAGLGGDGTHHPGRQGAHPAAMQLSADRGGAASAGSIPTSRCWR